MKTNIGTLDRVIRITSGLLLVMMFALDIIGPWGLLGIVLLGTRLLRMEPSPMNAPASTPSISSGATASRAFAAPTVWMRCAISAGA